MTNQSHAFEFFYKITQDDYVAKLKEDFKNDMEDPIDSYDEVTETKTILNRQYLMHAIGNIETKISFNGHLRQMLLKEEAKLISYINTQYLENHIPDENNRFLKDVEKQLNNLLKELKPNGTTAEPLIRNSIERMLTIVNDHSNREEHSDIPTKSLTFNIKSEKLRKLHSSLKGSGLIGTTYEPFRLILQNKEKGLTIDWQGNVPEFAMFIRGLNSRNLIVCHTTFVWENIAPYFTLVKAKKGFKFSNLRNQGLPKDPTKVEKALQTLN